MFDKSYKLLNFYGRIAIDFYSFVWSEKTIFGIFIVPCYEYYVYFLCTIVSISIHIYFTKNFIFLRRIFVPAISRVCIYVSTFLVRGYSLKIVPYGYKKNKRPSKKIPRWTTLNGMMYLWTRVCLKLTTNHICKDVAKVKVSRWYPGVSHAMLIKMCLYFNCHLCDTRHQQDV